MNIAYTCKHTNYSSLQTINVFLWQEADLRSPPPPQIRKNPEGKPRFKAHARILVAGAGAE